MSFYPTDGTHETKAPTCPGCGYEFDTSDGSYYPQSSSEQTFEEECPQCGLKLEINAELECNWRITHPQQCEVVRGHHVVFTNKYNGERTCPWCSKPLKCDCPNKAECPHIEVPS